MIRNPCGRLMVIEVLLTNVIDSDLILPNIRNRDYITFTSTGAS